MPEGDCKFAACQTLNETPFSIQEMIVAVATLVIVSMALSILL